MHEQNFRLLMSVMEPSWKVTELGEELEEAK